jgi:hypothetical protein
VLRSFWIPFEAVNFHNPGWIGDSGVHHDHHTCVSTWRCCSCGVRVVVPRSSMTLRSATSTSPTSLVREH